MVNKTIERTETEGKGKIIVRLEVLDKKFEVVKLYLPDEKEYEEALTEAQHELSDMISDGFPQDVNRKISYQIDERTQEETKELYKENE